MSRSLEDGEGVHGKYVPGTYRPLQNKDNDYLMDRAAQKTGRFYSGIDGIAMQDALVQESMGPIQDCTKENPVSTDNSVVLARHCLMKAAKAPRQGVEPPGRNPATHRVRSVSVILPPDVAFKEAAKDALKAKAGVAHVTV